MKLTKFSLILCAIGISFLSHAQKDPIKFGKINEDDLSKESYEIDPEAEAIILNDFGRSWFEYSNTKDNFQYRYERIVRIKILKKEGYKWADAKVSFYQGSGGTKESVVGIKGNTYNLENGKVVKTKLGKESIFEEQITSNWNRMKFTMPDVKEGSVIEYTYSITSEYIAEFRPWNFQYSIPVLHSEYRAVIPEYYKYQQIQQGYAGFETETDKVPEKFTINYETSPGRGGKTEKGSYELESMSEKYRWWADNLPALKREPYITSLDNYYSRIEFMLAYTKSPRGAINNHMGDYNSFNKTLLEGPSYGRLLEGGGFLKEPLAAIQAKYPSKEEQVVAIYNHVRDHMTWTGGYGKYVTNNLRNAYKDRKGRTSDINLLLILMMREAGIQADPVVLASRDAFRMHPVYPISSKINYVIAQITIDGKTILMDATDKNRPYYILPERALSGKGWVVRENQAGWINLRNKESKNTKVIVNLKVEDGLLVGDVVETEESLLAVQSLESFKESKEDYEKYYTENSDWTITELDIKPDTEKELKLVHKYNVEHTEDLTGSNILYLNPVIFTSLTENPFKLETRQFPVEYACPEKVTYMLTLEVPNGYLVDEVPEAKAFGLPGNAGKFSYSSNLNGNKLSIIIQHKISKEMFSQQEYPNLREFYNMVVAKCSEQIVLKRKS